MFGVHATGVVHTGIFATASIGLDCWKGHPQLPLIQFYGVAVTLVWSAAVTYALLKLMSVFTPLRVSHEHELEGLGSVAAWRGASVNLLLWYR